MARRLLLAPAMARNRHQERALRIIQGLAGSDALDPEVSVPQASRRVDGVVTITEPSEGWGPIRSLVGERMLVVEHFSRPPSPAAWTRSVAKLAWLIDDWWRTRPASIMRPPMLLVLSYGHPRKALSLLPALQPLEVPGIWLQPRPLLGDLLLVDIRRLPAHQPGTSVLRLVVIPQSKAEADAAIAALLDDSSLVESTKRRFLETLMDPTTPSTEEEQRSIVDRVLAEGRQEGRLQGRQEGRRQELLDLATELLGAETAQRLASIGDTDELHRRVMDLLSRR